MTFRVQLDPQWVPLESRPHAVTSGMFSAATTDVDALDTALRGFSAAVHPALRPTGLASMIVCTSAECQQVTGRTIDSQFTDSAGVTFFGPDPVAAGWPADQRGGFLITIAIDTTGQQGVNAVTFVHEWGHAIDARWLHATGVRRAARQDFAELWSRMAAVGAPIIAAGGWAYGWTSIIEGWAEVFRCVALEAIDLQPVHFGRTPTQELQYLTTGTVGVENADTALARQIIGALTVPPLDTPLALGNVTAPAVTVAGTVS